MDQKEDKDDHPRALLVAQSLAGAPSLPVGSPWSLVNPPNFLILEPASAALMCLMDLETSDKHTSAPNNAFRPTLAGALIAAFDITPLGSSRAGKMLWDFLLDVDW